MAGLDSIDKKINILVVDDHNLTRDMVRSILKQFGFTNITCVENGYLALDYVRNHNVGLIVCDWNMPGMSGLEVLRQVRAEEKFLKMPFLMLTAEAYRENVAEALKAGVSDYIAKPFTSQTLGEKIEAVLCKK